MISSQIEHFDIEVSYNIKELLTKAADIDGCSLTTLVLNAAIDKAREILQSQQEIVLSPSDWAAFIHSLENSPEPTEALKSALKEYQDSGMN